MPRGLTCLIKDRRGEALFTHWLKGTDHRLQIFGRKSKLK